jgi:hypothetical protein
MAGADSLQGIYFMAADILKGNPLHPGIYKKRVPNRTPFFNFFADLD